MKRKARKVNRINDVDPIAQQRLPNKYNVAVVKIVLEFERPQRKNLSSRTGDLMVIRHPAGMLWVHVEKNQGGLEV